MTIKALKGHRWFIWTIVFLIVSGVSLITYINYSSATAPENGPVDWPVYHFSKTPVKKIPVKKPLKH